MARKYADLVVLALAALAGGCGPGAGASTSDASKQRSIIAPLALQGFLLHVSATRASPGEPIAVTYEVPDGRSSADWIGLYAVGSGNDSYLDYRYATGASSGSLLMPAPSQPGTYEFRYLLDDGYDSATTSLTVTVAGN